MSEHDDASLIASAHEAGRRSRDAEFYAVVEQRQEAQGRHNVEMSALAAQLTSAREVAREIADGLERTGLGSSDDDLRRLDVIEEKARELVAMLEKTK